MKSPLLIDLLFGKAAITSCLRVLVQQIWAYTSLMIKSDKKATKATRNFSF